MSDDRRYWEELVSAYLRDVQRSLSRVDHPRKSELLGDLRRHLDELYADTPREDRTPDHLASLIAEVGAPEEYAELLSPATGASPQAWYRRRSVKVVLGLIFLLVAAKTFVLPDGQTCQLYLRSLLGTNYTPAPFFTRANFRQIQPGMSKDEVRELVGYPIKRSLLANADGELIGSLWSYSTVVAPGASRYQWFRVEFAADTKRVRSTGDSGENYQTGYPVPGAPLPIWVKSLKKRIGSLSLERADGTKQLLRPSDKGLYLLYPLTFPKGENVADRLDRAATSAEEKFGWLKKEGCSIFYVFLRGAYEPDMAGILATNPPERRAVTFVRSRPEFDRKPGVRLYKKGVLYKLPDIVNGMDKGDSDADRRWLLRRLVASDA